jgi:PIN domain nuclease of toxin-antitoxin system
MGVNYLIDTHVLLWWLFNDPKLMPECQDIIRNPDHRILVSSVSAWEIATKYQ